MQVYEIKLKYNHLREHNIASNIKFLVCLNDIFLKVSEIHFRYVNMKQTKALLIANVKHFKVSCVFIYYVLTAIHGLENK